MSAIVAECYFIDVGQGTSQVINLGDDSAIIIDCGPSYTILGELLTRLNIRRIAAVILSHNHVDHAAGLVGLIRQYRNSIDKIYLLQDKPAKNMNRQFAYLRSEVTNGHVPSPIPLIRNDNLMLYPYDKSTTSIELDLLFPAFFNNIDGQESRNPNYTSAVLLVSCGKKRILFPGDAEIDAWREINRIRDKQPVRCDVIAVPHHGGQIVRYRKQNETYQDLHDAIADDLNWLYTQAIICSTAIVSVGTSNVYPDQHPLPPQIAALRNSGAIVMCTQITGRCSSDLERLRPGVLDPLTTPCQSCPTKTTTGDGQSKDVACASTVIVQICQQELIVEQLQNHQSAIDAKLTEPINYPLCRR